MDGFADRRLSHSSKAPSLEIGCKGSHKNRYRQIFSLLFTAAVGFFVIFVAIVPFQRTSLATATGVGIMAEGLVDVPYRIADGQDENDDDNCSLHGKGNRLQTGEFSEQHLVDDLYPAPAFLDVLAYIIYIIK